MTEQQVQSKVIKKYEAQGYYVIKLVKTNKNGITDLLCLKVGIVPVFIEVKKKKGIISELQRFRIDEQRELGFKAFVTDGDTILY